MDKKICVYTCITGDYDDIKEFPDFKEDGIDYYLFTNNKKIKSDFWNVIYIENDGLDNIRLARKLKILGHEIINNNYDISVWIDGSIVLRSKITTFLSECCDLETYDLIGFKHRYRDCIYVEGKACLYHNKEKKEVILKQIEFLKKQDYPEHNGLIESTVLVRNVKNKGVIETCKLWFDMVQKFSYRDQLSFNYAAYEKKLNFNLLELDVFDNDYFIFDSHNFKENLSFIAYFDNNLSIDDLDFDLIVQGNYIKKDDIYTAEIIIPKKCNIINLRVNKRMSEASIKKVRLNNEIVDYKVVEEFFFDDDNEFNGICFNGNFEEGEKIVISYQCCDSFLNKQIEEERNINNILIRDNDILRTDIVDLQNQINELLNSNSYKITKPLRKIREILKK